MKPFVFFTNEQYNNLTTAEQAMYDAAVKAYVLAFRTANPNGLTVLTEISRVDAMPNVNGRVVVLCVPQPMLPVGSSGFAAFQFAPQYLDRIARTASIPNGVALHAILASCFEPSHMEVTCRPVLKGEKFVKADKTEGTYEVSHMRYENEILKLSDDAIGLVGAAYQVVVKDAFKDAFAGAPKRKIAAAAAETEVTP